MLPMKTIIQEEINGCGIAAVATILQKPYEELQAVANSLAIFASDKRLFSDTEYIRRLLKQYSVPISDQEIPFVSWQTLPDLALIATQYHIENNIAYWHWSVFQRMAGQAVVLDPAAHLKNHQRTDFEAISVEWYIEVFNIK